MKQIGIDIQNIISFSVFGNSVFWNLNNKYSVFQYSVLRILLFNVLIFSILALIPFYINVDL